jgi:hypothetical protein
MGRIKSYTDEDLRNAIANCHSWRQTAFKIGLNGDGGSNATTLKRRAEELQIDTSHFLGMGWNLNGIPANKKPLSELLRDGVLVRPHAIKSRLIEEGLLLDECSKCKLSKIWFGEPIVLELDHIDGDRFNNRLENIRLLCPNCHSQTSNFRGRTQSKTRSFKRFCLDCGCGIRRESISGKCRKCVVPVRRPSGRIKVQKNCEQCKNLFTSKNQAQRYCSSSCFSVSRRLIERPSKEMLLADLSILSYVALGKKYRVSDNAVRKWARGYGLIE